MCGPFQRYEIGFAFMNPSLKTGALYQVCGSMPEKNGYQSVSVFFHEEYDEGFEPERAQPYSEAVRWTGEQAAVQGDRKESRSTLMRSIR